VKKKISDIAEVRMGYHIRGRVREDPDGNALLLQIRDVDQQGNFDENELAVLDVPNLESHSLRGGDVIFLARGAGRFAFLFQGSLSESIIPASYFMVLQPCEHVDPAYLVWAINQPRFQRQVDVASSKTAVPQVTKTRFLELTVDVPDVVTQRRVAEIDRLMKQEIDLVNRLQGQRATLLRAFSRCQSDI